MKTVVKLECPICGNSYIHYRVKSCTYICRHCGHIWPKSDLERAKELEILEEQVDEIKKELGIQGGSHD